MEDALILPALALGFAAIITTTAVGQLDARRPDWPLWLKLVLTSLAPPVAFLLFIGAIVIAAGGIRNVVTSSHRLLDLAEVAGKLWLWGVLCAIVIGCSRLRASNGKPARFSQRRFITGQFRFSLEKVLLFGCLNVFILELTRGSWLLALVGAGFIYAVVVLRRGARRSPRGQFNRQ